MIVTLLFILTQLSVSSPQKEIQVDIMKTPFREVISDTTITIHDASGDRGLVLIFYEKGCPYNKHYKARLNGLISTYQSNGIKFALITEKDTLNTGLKTHYIFTDPDRSVRYRLGAKKTPEVYLFAKNYERLTVVYHGAIDNNPFNEQDISKHYLREAINNVISRERQEKISTNPYGCYFD